MRLRILIPLLTVLLMASNSTAFMNYTLSDTGSVLPANSVIDIRSDGTRVWIGSSNGVAYTTDGGTTWVIFDSDDGFESNSISGLAVTPHLVWAASSRSEIREGEQIPIGTGLGRTFNNGADWDIYTPQQASYYGQIVYDLAITDSTVWAACFYGGLIRSHHDDSLFEADSVFYNVFPDSATREDFESGRYQSLRNRFFSVKADTTHPDTTVIYGGSAAGIFQFIFATSDSIPDTVYNYYYADTNATPGQRLPGDFVITLGIQYLDDPVIWAGCKPTTSGEIAISRSTDGGSTWYTSDASRGFECWNFAFDDSIIYAATSQGLIRSEDFGETWEMFGNFVDYENGNLYLRETFYAVEIVRDTIWGGGPDGVVRSTDDGATWKVFRSYIPAGSADAGDSYAYPVPFSPMRGSGYVRFHYKAPSTTTATIKVYDFGMNMVKTIVENKRITAGTEYDNDIWDGYNRKGDMVHNGVYFYRIKMDDGTDWWGKLAVLK